VSRPKLSEITTLDFQSMMIGKQLGRGIARKVYEFLPDPKYVIKIEDRSGSFQNIEEYRFWNEQRNYKPVAQWLAPIHSISPSGTILIQRRITPITKEQLPAKVPAWMTDMKLEHFGKLDGKIVICDYAFTTRGLSTRLVRNRAIDYER
jgi:hypothetical protein